MLRFQRLGEEFEDELHFAEDEVVDEGLDLAGEDARGDEGCVLGDEAGWLECEDGLGRYAEVTGHDVVHCVDG